MPKLSEKEKRNKLIVLLGPTASGKTALSLKLTKKYGGEIISADSRQVYRGMDVGTGKIKLKNRKAAGIRHHLIDIASPKRTFTVAQYQKQARRAIKDILAREKIPLIVGGTGFYIEAIIYDRKFPQVKPNLRIRTKLEKLSPEQLFERLQKKDPQRAKTIEKKNKRRLIRAIEIIEAIGKVPPLNSPFSPSLTKEGVGGVLILGIRRTDKELRNLINRRVDARVPGIIREIKNLRKTGISFKRLINFGLEYRYFSRYLQGKLAKSETVAQLKTGTWQFAKRQYTWFKRLPVVWVKNQKQAEKEIRNFLK